MEKTEIKEETGTQKIQEDEEIGTQEDEQQGATELVFAHEALLDVLRDADEAHKALPDLGNWNARIEEGEVTDKEKWELERLTKKHSEAVSKIPIQVAARVRDKIPKEHLEEIVLLLLEISHRNFSDWPLCLIDFFRNHGTSLEAIQNFLDDQGLEDWKVIENCDTCGIPHVRNTKDISKKIEASIIEIEGMPSSLQGIFKRMLEL